MQHKSSCPPLHIVIVCFNCGADICRVLEDLRTGDYPTEQLRVLVVDNASEDDSLALLRACNFPQLRVIPAGRNLGFGAGCNLAFQHIEGPGRVLLLNPDMRLAGDSLTQLTMFANEYPHCGIWGGATSDASGQPDGKNAWREPTLFGLFSWAVFGDAILKKLGLPIPNGYGADELRRDGSVDAISGCFFLIEQKLLRDLGGFDEQFFLYSEEIDLCRRARYLGARPRITQNARVIHFGSQTLNSLNKLRYLYHSKLLYCHKYWSQPKTAVARFIILLGSLMRLVSFSAFSIFRRNYRDQVSCWWQFLKLQLGWRFPDAQGSAAVDHHSRT